MAPNFAKGTRWRFHNASTGEATDYVLDMRFPKSDLYRLERADDPERAAQVYMPTLLRGPRNGTSYWECLDQRSA